MFNTKDYETFNSQLIHMVNKEMDMFMIISHLPKNFNIKKLELYAIQILICIISLSPFILEIILILLLIIKKEKGVIILSIVNTLFALLSEHTVDSFF